MSLHVHLRCSLILLGIVTTMLSSTAYADDEPETSFCSFLKEIKANNLTLRSYRDAITAAKADEQQAGLLPNPELISTLENFGGDLAGASQAETTIALQQRIELGGKREARRGKAINATERLEVEAQTAFRLFHAEILKLYGEYQATQDEIAVLERHTKKLNSLAALLRKKAAAGGALPFEASRLELQGKEHALRIRALQTKLKRLNDAFSVLSGGTHSFPEHLAPIRLQSEPVIGSTLPPDSAKLKGALLTVEDYQYELAAAEAAAIPDLVLEGGYRRLEETKDDTFVGGVSVTLPIFTGNRRAIQAAKQRVSAAQARALQARLEVEHEQQALERTLILLFDERDELKESLLPAAEAAYRDAVEAMRRGRLGFLNLQEMSEQLLRYQRRDARINAEILSVGAELYLVSGIYPKMEGTESCTPE